MFRSFRIGSLLGIPIKLDVTFLLILPAFAWLIAIQIGDLVPLLNGLLGTAIDGEAVTRGSTPWLLGAAAAIGLFASVLAHELGHSVVAIRYGFPIDSITLWLLGGVAQLSEQPTNWRQELAIAIAGPIVSVGLGVGFYALVLVVPATLETVQFVFAYLAVINVVLAAFNMLPGFPMDGGRVLRAILGRNRPFAVATAQAAQVGKTFALLLGLFGLLAFNILLIAIAFFIYIAATGEARQTAIQAAIEGITVADVMTPVDELDTVSPETTITELLDAMMEHRHTGFPVVENGSIAGVVTLEDVRAVPPSERDSRTVRAVMATDLETLSPTEEAWEALVSLQRNDIGRLVVLDDRERLAGLVTRTDLITALNVGAVRSAGGTVDRPSAERPDDAPQPVEKPRW
ncbi:CBS domain-containing protein [Natronococcus sp. A-GB1]|uniref:CBS domain-containing protein n=1 Tax=Natronococcus sp. A-GB1 TaxID=3037648 RepID=UPI00241C608F|nr:CBS domain-containing protein [Natronococcus sp. A-GB1]MDG5761263.1 CBS domain-containing protein [Natronococcus sp. A-GB1]